jgi:hypothetical protein
MAKSKTSVLSSAAMGPKGDWSGIAYSLYLVLVCGVTLTASIFSAGNVLQGAIDLVIPAQVYVDKNTYDESIKANRPMTSVEFAAAKAEQTEQNANQRLRDMLHSMVTLLTMGAAFAYHWPIFRKRVK